MSGFMSFIWGACKVITGFGIFFGVCYMIAKMGDWITAWSLRHERKLQSFTLIYPGFMTTEKLKDVVDRINESMKVGVDHTQKRSRIKLKDIVSITTLPSPNGEQFTIWYKEKPPKPERNYWGYRADYYGHGHGGSKKTY